MTLARAVIALIVGALLFGANDLNSCSYEPLRAIFTTERYREDVDGKFGKGQLGILQPAFPRAYLTVAYRELSGLKWSGDILEVPGTQPMPQPGWQAWSEARAVTGVPPTYTNPYKEDPDSHMVFLNCKDDAFVTAGATLKKLIQSDGPNSAPVREWMEAQDLVFQNCSGGPVIPQPLKDSVERAYQIAAAHFYSRQYEEARADFELIAKDARSPWHGIAPYLIARTMIREGNLEGAEKQVQRILKDPAQKDGYERAQRLGAWIRVRLHPVERMVETAKAMMEADPADLHETLKDYTYLYDLEENQAGSLSQVAAMNDLTDWILDFQHSDAVEGHAVERWKATHSTAWLIAALAAKPEEEATRTDLLKAAGATTRESTGYFSVQYYAIALLKGDAARARLDEVLNAKPPLAAKNLLVAERMRWARSWQEFLRDAQREPVDMDGYDYAAGTTGSTHTTSEIGFDEDAIFALNHFVPVSVEASGAMDEKLPVSVRRQLAMAAWTKALLLNKIDAARKLGPAMSELYPAMKADLERLRTAPAGEEKFAGVWAMLQNPGANPMAKAGFGRVPTAGRLDEFRDNWWCAVPPPAGLGGLSGLYGQEQPNGDFLSAEERETAKAENSAVSALGAAPDWLAAETMKFAKTHPGDARVPEALHLVVRATHYGCGDKDTADYAKAAFELLHGRYPASEWAKETPYWFKN